jgi:ParB-like chromosome segregation protein Spo0J
VRVLAAEQLGLAEIPVIVLSHLSESQRRALVIADNRIAENAGWDDAMLKAEIAALHEDAFDLDLLGFAEEELGRLLDGLDANTGDAGVADGEQASQVSTETQRSTLGQSASAFHPSRCSMPEKVGGKTASGPGSILASVPNSDAVKARPMAPPTA